MHSSANNSILPFNYSSEYSGCRSPYYTYVISEIVIVFNIFVGYPANIMVIWLVARKEIDSSTSDVFFINLAIVDALYSMTDIFKFFIIVYFPGVGYYFSLAMRGIKETSPLFLTCICLDRYVAVVHPIVFTRIEDNKIRMIIPMFVWPFMISFGFIRGWQSYYAGIFYSVMILIISMIMFYCNFSLMRSLRKSVLGKEKISPMKKKAQRTVQITLGIIVIHYLPTAAFTPLFPIGELQTICMILVMASFILDISCITDPLLSISKVKQLSCLNNFPCICCRSPSPEPHYVST